MPRSDKTDKFAGRTLGLFLIDGFALMSYAAVVEPFGPRTIWRGASSTDGRISRSTAARYALPMAQTSLPIARSEGRLSAIRCSSWREATRLLFPMSKRLPGSGVWLARTCGLREFPAARSSSRAQGCSTAIGQRSTAIHRPAFLDAFPTLALEPSLYVIDRRRLTCAGAARRS